jgi:tetratricopeptide (TPR) repeat protein
LRRFAKAVEAFRHAIELAPSDPLLWQELGQVYINQAQETLALAALQKSLALDSTVPQTEQLLGTIWAEPGGDTVKAEAFFREAIRLQPDYAQAHTNLAVLLSQRNRIEEAGYHFERAIHLRPDYALARLNYGLMLTKLHRVDAAREQLGQAAVSSDPAIREAARRLLSESSTVH